jgi:hypothetical protein
MFARIEMNNPMNEIVRVSGEHLHEIVNDRDDQRHILRNNHKRKATESITDRPNNASCALLKIQK